MLLEQTNTTISIKKNLSEVVPGKWLNGSRYLHLGGITCLHIHAVCCVAISSGFKMFSVAGKLVKIQNVN